MKNQLVNCKSCGAEIAKTAKACPHCGAKQHRGVLKTCIMILLIVIVISAIIASGEKNDEPALVEKDLQTTDLDTQGAANNSPEPEQPSVFTVGDTVALNDINVTLVSVTENNGGNYMTPSNGKVFVVCEFEIENNSGKDIAVSSMLSFDAYVDDYATGMNLSAMLSTDKTQLDGTVASGKKMNGVIGYEVSPEWSKIEINFTPDF